jgi:DNA-binding protein Fis
MGPPVRAASVVPLHRREANDNQILAAQIIGIDRVSLWCKLKRYEPEEA